HDQSAQNAPEQDGLLLFSRYFKVAEQKDENKKVIYAQRFFKKVAGYEFQALCRAKPIMDKDGKAARQSDPEHAAQERGLEGHHPPTAVQHRQIKNQEGNDGGVEDDPKADVHGSSAIRRRRGPVPEKMERTGPCTGIKNEARRNEKAKA